MGEVFRALATAPDGTEVPVAIKRIVPMHAGSSDLADRFVARATAMTRLAHPNIVEVLDFGLGDQGDFYLILELIQGIDLGRLCKWVWTRGESLPVPLALFIAAEALKGLSYAHERSAAEGDLLVHRDVSPGNVLVSSAGAVKIADFGVALAPRGDAARARDLVGKPSYMPPEQFDGQHVDARADVFALGVVLFQMLTGSKPFAGISAATRMAAAREGQILRASELRPGLSEDLEEILTRALAPNREDRFPDAGAMLAAIDAVRARIEPPSEAGELAALVSAVVRDPPESRRPAPLGSEQADDDDLEGRELIRVDTTSPPLLVVAERRAPREDEPEQAVDRLEWGAAPSGSGSPGSVAPPSAPTSSVHPLTSAIGEGETLEPLVRAEASAVVASAEHDAASLVDSSRPTAPRSRRGTPGGKRPWLFATTAGVMAVAVLSLVVRVRPSTVDAGLAAGDGHAVARAGLANVVRVTCMRAPAPAAPWSARPQ